MDRAVAAWFNIASLYISVVFSVFGTFVSLDKIATWNGSTLNYIIEGDCTLYSTSSNIQKNALEIY